MPELEDGSAPDADVHGDDPIVPIYREHTELQMLAARFHELAGQLERGEAVGAVDLQDAENVHRMFLVGLHYRREEAVRAAVSPTAEPSIQAGFDRCAKEHPRAVEFESRLRELGATSPARNAGPLAELLHREADRILEHDRLEEETIYRPIHPHLTPDVRARILHATAALSGEAAAAHARLAAFSSKANAAAD